MRTLKGGRAMAAALLLGSAMLPASSSSARAVAHEIAETASAVNFEAFLDRLMGAESGGQTRAKNPRSSALGTFQFIKSTFLEVARRHFAREVDGLSEDQILELRTDRGFARRAASAFCRDNIGQLKAHGLEPTFADLRLAFLLGAGDAARVLKAGPATPAVQLLSRPVVRANPFMLRMTAADLRAKSIRDVEHDREHWVARAPSPRERPAASVRPFGNQSASYGIDKRDCKLASCRKFTVMQVRKASPRSGRKK